MVKRATETDQEKTMDQKRKELGLDPSYSSK